MAHAVTEFKIISLQHRFADDILPLIQPLAGDESTITGLQNQIIVRATPEKMAEIEQIIASLDVVQKNLKITVSHQKNQTQFSDGAGATIRKRFGNVEINNNTHRSQRNRADGVQIGVENQSRATRSNSHQFINVLDGGEGFIRVGQSVPFTQEWVRYMQRYISVQRTTTYVDITTGFGVRARSVGNQVELEITPRIAQQNQQGFIDFEELTTVVRVNKGEWFDLGGTMQQSDEVSRAILSYKNQRQTTDGTLEIRVD